MRATHALIGLAATLSLTASVVLMAAPATPVDRGLVVHEWGTFSSFSGSDGILLKFNPANTDLPAFVHHGAIFTKSGLTGTVSLETPVTYFYTGKPLTIDVRAEFPAGVFSDWYPRTNIVVSSKAMTWAEVRILPGDENPLPMSPGDNHYYAARATDAAPLEVTSKIENKEVVERERFLFYRGVGDPKLPLTVTAAEGGTFTLRAARDGVVSAAIVMEAKGGRVRFRTVGPLTAAAPTAVTLPADWSEAEPVRATLVRLLTGAGLFEKEARAMVKTWESAWLKDEGTRVLYVLASGWTDGTLPLTVTPKPAVMVRVMVGRHDVLTPELEREIKELIRRQPSDLTATKVLLARLGRFAAPARQNAERDLQRR